MLPTVPTPLLQRVVAGMQKFAPLSLADTAWDNVGVLVESPHVPSSDPPAVLLTIDMTPKVLAEAVAKKCSVVVAYHPLIFSGLKKLSLADPKQATVLHCAQQGISVYCPHTSLDATEGGINDWLIDVVGGHARQVIQPVLPTGKRALSDAEREACRTGYGRFARLNEGVPFATMLARVKSALGISSVRVALPPNFETPDSIVFRSVAVCAGSGSSVFRMLQPSQKPDLLLTGEMGHHDVLAAVESGSVVFLTEHTNTERGFLPKLREILLPDLAEVEIHVAETDRDPLMPY